MLIKKIALIIIIFSFLSVITTYAQEKFIYTNTNFTRKMVVDDEKEILYVASTGGLLIYDIIDNADGVSCKLHDNGNNKGNPLTTLDGLAYNDNSELAVNDKGNMFIKNTFFGFIVSYQSYVDADFVYHLEGPYDYHVNNVLDEFIKEQHDNLEPNGDEWNADEWYIDKKDGHIWYISGIYLKEYCPEIGNDSEEENPKVYSPPEYDGMAGSAIAYNMIFKDVNSDRPDHTYLWLPSVGYSIFRFDMFYKDYLENNDETKRDLAWDHFAKEGNTDVMINIYEAQKAPDGSVWFNGYYKCFRFLYNADGNDSIDDFSEYGEADGLPMFRSRAIAIDSSGAIWIGSYGGLVRYKEGDQKEWKRFINKYTGDNNDSLTNYYILDLETDKKGRIWVGTRNGVFVSKDNGDTFTYISSSNSLSDNTIIKVLSELKVNPDVEGGIWGGTYSSGIFYFNVVDGKFIKYYASDLPPSISSNFINDMVIDGQNRLWVGTDEGLTLKTGNKSVKYDNEGRWESSANGWELKDSSDNAKLPGVRIDAVAVDENNNLYCGISPGEEIQGGFVKIRADGSIDTTDDTIHKVSSSFDMTLVDLFVETIDPKNDIVRIWATSYANGLYLYEDNVWNVIDFPYPFRTDNINCIAKPGSDSILMTLLDGLLKDSIWFGTNGDGVFILYKVNEEERWFNINMDDPYSPQCLAQNKVYCIFFHNDDIWFGYESNGATKWNLKDPSNPIHYTQEDGLADSTVYSITVDTQDKVWFGTYGGLSVFDE
jgi:ligand-binding sensor domain-containing protein